MVGLDQNGEFVLSTGGGVILSSYAGNASASRAPAWSMLFAMLCGCDKIRRVCKLAAYNADKPGRRRYAEEEDRNSRERQQKVNEILLYHCDKCGCNG